MLPIHPPNFALVANVSFPIITREANTEVAKFGQVQKEAKKRWTKLNGGAKAMSMLEKLSLISKKEETAGKPGAPGGNTNPFLLAMKKLPDAQPNPSPNINSIASMFSPVKMKMKQMEGPESSGGSLFNLTEAPETTSAANNNSKPKPKKTKKKFNPKPKPKPKPNQPRKRLTPKEKEKLLMSRTRFVDELINELDDKPTISDEEINCIIEFMDDDNSGTIDEAEFAHAIKQAKRGKVADENICELLTKLDNELRVKSIRLSDLFRQFDLSNDGILSTWEIREGLNTLCDVSYEKQCERRKLKKAAVMGSWKDKEDERDATKKWLTSAVSLPAEFVASRDFFLRDVKTPERFDKYLQVVVGSNSLKNKDRVKLPEPNKAREERVAMRFDDTNIITRNVPFDINEIDDESVHTHILDLVKEEFNIEKREKFKAVHADHSEAPFNERRRMKNSGGKHLLNQYETEHAMELADEMAPLKNPTLGGVEGGGTGRDSSSPVSCTSDDQAEFMRKYGLDDGEHAQLIADDSSLGSLGDTSFMSSLDDDESSLGSLGGDSVGYGGGRSVVSNITNATGMSTSSTFFLEEIRKARGVTENSDKEIASLVKFLGLNMNTLGAIKQRHFEQRTFKNLYKTRMQSLSNNYYLPTSVLNVLERERMLKGVTKEDLTNLKPKQRAVRMTILKSKEEHRANFIKMEIKRSRGAGSPLQSFFEQEQAEFVMQQAELGGMESGMGMGGIGGVGEVRSRIAEGENDGMGGGGIEEEEEGLNFSMESVQLVRTVNANPIANVKNIVTAKHLGHNTVSLMRSNREKSVASGRLSPVQMLEIQAKKHKRKLLDGLESDLDEEGGGDLYSL